MRSLPPRMNRNGGRRRAPIYRPDTLTKLLGAIVVTSLWRFQDVIGGLSALKLPLLISILALIALALDTTPLRRFKYMKSPITWLVLYLFIHLTLATATSLNMARSRSFMVRDFLTTIAAFVIVACTIRSVKELRWIAGVHILGAAVYCFMVLLRFRAMDNVGRLCCTPYYDANDISLVLVSTLPFFFFFFRDGATAKIRLLALIALLPILPVFQLAGSRGGFLGLMTVILGAVVAYRGIKPGKRVMSVAAGMIVLLILGGASYREKIVSIIHPEDDYNMTEEEGRIGMWKAGIALAKQHPTLGYGPRSFGEAYGTFSPRAIREGGVPWRAAHNAYVELAAEAGFPASICFIAILLTAIAICWRVRNRASNPRFGSDGQLLAMLAQSNAIGLIGYVVSSVFLSAEYLTITYFMLGLTVAFGKVLKTLEQQTGGPTQGTVGRRPMRARVQPGRPVSGLPARA